MRTTINLDDDLIATAQEYTGLTEKSALVREALKELIQREAARRLARLGGSQPQLKPIPRRPRKTAEEMYQEEMANATPTQRGEIIFRRDQEQKRRREPPLTRPSWKRE